MDNLLKNKTAVITGGSSGNGRAIAMRFAEQGANVVIADVRSEPRESGTPTHEEIATKLGGQAIFVRCDVTELSDLRAAVNAAEAYGGIDIMVNNAGIIKIGSISELTEKMYDAVLDVNLKGTFLGCKVAAERMLGSEGGNIINISSTAGMVGISENSIYCASKGAVRLLTYSLAAELGPYIRVNVILPGTTETQMVTNDVQIIGTEDGKKQQQSIPLRRFGKPEDIGNAALYLASDLASYVTGESLVVDGGFLHA
jgi:NAD(P)-dependent dehydrogenase (short-subunit alcohol dehydrogenase family)